MDDKTQLSGSSLADDEKTKLLADSDEGGRTQVASDTSQASPADDSTRLVSEGAGRDDATRLVVDDDATQLLSEKTQALTDGTTILANTTVIADGATTVLGTDGTQLQDDSATLLNNTTRAPTPSASPLAKMVKGYVIKDRFVLEKKLGEGGMGAVFHARDLRKEEAKDPNPFVAIKVITGLLQKNSKAVIALQRETKKSQTLAHPNVITVYDFDRDGEVYFMTMESLRGRTLDDYITGGEGTTDEKIKFINDIANGVAYAHKRNIIHSDLKPENVFVTEDNEIKILDFGIARAFAQGDSPSADPDEIVGLTPTYASCEMFEGKDPHPSDDVYALGLMAYELLSGKHPFGRRSALEAAKEKLTVKKLKGLTGYQWLAVANALQFRREVRLPDAIEFQRKFSGAGLLVKRLSVALLLIVAAFGLYIGLYQPEAGPDIPFAELSPVVQQDVLGKLTEGRQALKFGDVNGALFYFDQAYALHPRNKEAVVELQALVEKFLAHYESLGAVITREKKIQAISELLKFESLSQNKTLVDYYGELKQ